MKTKTVTETRTVEDLLTEAKNEIESLKDEMEEWRDKLDENDGLRETQKYSEVEEAADALDRSYSEIDSAYEHLMETLSQEYRNTKLTVSYPKPYGRFNFPRWARLGYCLKYLEAVKTFLELAPQYKTDSEFQSDVDALYQDELENVDFPGMY